MLIQRSRDDRDAIAIDAATVPGDLDTYVSVRYWAAARSAAGVADERLPVSGPITLEKLVSRLSQGRDDLAAILAICSVIIDDVPVSSSDPATVVVSQGTNVEFLPPFAGG